MQIRGGALNENSLLGAHGEKKKNTHKVQRRLKPLLVGRGKDTLQKQATAASPCPTQGTNKRTEETQKRSSLEPTLAASFIHR